MTVHEPTEPSLEVLLREANVEGRRTLICSLSDSDLVHIYALLSDERVVANVEHFRSFWRKSAAAICRLARTIEANERRCHSFAAPFGRSLRSFAPFFIDHPINQLVGWHWAGEGISLENVAAQLL